MTDRAALLERCLRLEAQLLGVPLDPPVAELPAPPPAPVRVVMRGTLLRKATPADVLMMRTLRARGLSYRAIGSRVGFSESTARIYTRDVQVAR